MFLQGLLADSFRFFRNHLVSIVLIIVPVVLPVELFRARYAESLLGSESTFISELPLLLLGLMAYPIYTAGVILFIASEVSGTRLKTRDCWLLGLRFWWTFLLLAMMMGVVTTVGFLLFLVPGLIALARFSFAEFNLLLNGRSPPDAMRLSWDETRPYFWPILGGHLIIFAAVYLPYFALVFVLKDLEVDLGIFHVVLDSLYVVLGSLFTIFRFRVYHLVHERLDLGLRPAADQDPTSEQGNGN